MYQKSQPYDVATVYWDKEWDKQNFLAPFLRPNDPENQNLEKKTPGDIRSILLYIHVYHKWKSNVISWSIRWDRQKLLSFWAIFCPFSPLTTRKIKILKKWKKCLEISFYRCLPQVTITWCMVPEISSATDRIFCQFGPFFALLTLSQPKKSLFYKNEKSTRRYYHFTKVYHFLYSVFCYFTSLTA